MQQDASSSGDCVFVRVVRGRGLSASRGLGASLGAAASSMARRSSGAAAREPTCRVLVRCGRLEAWTAPVEETAEPEWDSANLFMFPCDNVRSARQLVFEVFDGGGMFDRRVGAARVAPGVGSFARRAPGHGTFVGRAARRRARGARGAPATAPRLLRLLSDEVLASADAVELGNDAASAVADAAGFDASSLPDLPGADRAAKLGEALLGDETLELGSRVVAPSKGGGGSRGGDEDAWMTEDFSMLVTQPYAACPLRLRVMRPRLASDLGVVGDEILGEVEIPLALEPPGKHCGGGGGAADPGLRELRLAYNPGKGLAADVAPSTWLPLRRRVANRDEADGVAASLRRGSDAPPSPRRAGGSAAGRRAVSGSFSRSRSRSSIRALGDHVGDLRVRAWIDEGYFHRDNDAIAEVDVVLAFYDAANNHAPLGKVKVRASGLATGHEYRKTRVAPRAAPLSYRRRRRRAAPQVSAALAIADPPIPRLVSEDVLRADARSWGGDVSEATHDWGSNISADLRKLKVAAMRLKDAGSVWAGYASELFEVYHWRPHGRTAPYAALGLVLIWHPSWIFTAFFAALFAALALNFPGRRKRQLDAIGGGARRDPDRPVHGDDDGDGDDDDDGGDDANFVAKLEHQYHDFVNMIMYTEHVFNEVSVVLEQGLAIFTWGDERISGVLALVFFLCVFVPVALVPPPLFYKVFFTFPYIVAMYPPVLEGPQPIEDCAGRVANVMNRLPAASEKVM
ncbi:hypothetical protein JL720_7296 [Aureococcus anophagefferens]|nr:hypothetical protein JL720_7296 [Aureococcus anophagefferens]